LSDFIDCCRLLSIAIAFLGTLNALYALWVGWRNRCWEKTITRDADGILPGAAPYTLEGECPHEPRTAILFIHGFNDTPRAWQLLVPRVHELTRATCRVMRLPHTSEPLRQQHRARLELWLNAIHIEVARLRTCHEKVFIAGHSLGGGLALLSSGSILLPSRQVREQDAPTTFVDGLILLSPLIRNKRKHVWMFETLSRLLSFSRACRTPFPKPIKTKDGRVYDYVRDRYVSFAVFRAMFDMTRRLDGVSPSSGPSEPRPPVLAFVSERDSLIDVPAALRFLSNANIITTREAGHVLALDTGWEKRAEEIAGFVSG